MALLFGAYVVPRGIAGWHLARGRTHHELRDAKAALESFAIAKRWQPDDPDVAFCLARASRKLGRMDDVRRHLRRAAMLGADPDRIRREETLAAAQSGQLAGTLPSLPELLVSSGDEADIVCEAFVEGLVMHHRFDDAAVLLDAWQRDFPNDPRPLAYRAAIQASGSNWETAWQYWQQALERAPQDTEYLRALAECSLERNRPQQALKHLAACERLAPELGREPEFLMLRYRALRQEGQDVAAGWLLQQFENDRDAPLDIQLELARRDVESGRMAVAADRLERIVAQAPWNVAARSLLAVPLTQLGRGDEAAVHSQAVAELTQRQQGLQNLLDQVRDEPENAAVRLEVARLLIDCADPREAIPWLLSVIDLDPAQIEAHRRLARLYRRTGVSQLADQHDRIVRRLADQQNDVPSAK
ncbi:MAG: tetratricopeptide repeat protein [Maioricimonas sp. JB049]